MNGKDLQLIYVECLAKLSQYQGSNAYQNLRKFITEYFNLNINQIVVAPSSEVSFFFVTGMEMEFFFRNRTNNGAENE
ncbi:MAG: hypothetical protein IAE91_00355 [Ignavibacteriaceae bacterium]|nr:hypothetical protein [Ignavibacteriaceae bacterium]